MSRFPKTLLPSVALMVLFGACAPLPTTPPANSPPAIPLSERMGNPDIPHSAIIEARGAALPATGAVSRGDVLLRIPFRYRHTAVLTEDVIGYSISVPGVRAAAGSPGYYAGSVISPPGFDGPGDLWCFVTAARQPLCLLRNQPPIAAIAPSGDNPWLWTRYVMATPGSDYVRTPIFSVQPIEIPGDLILEYRFEGWRDGTSRISEHAVGRFVQDVGTGPMKPLVTIAGRFTVVPDPEHPEQARIQQTP